MEIRNVAINSYRHPGLSDDELNILAKQFDNLTEEELGKELEDIKSMLFVNSSESVALYRMAMELYRVVWDRKQMEDKNKDILTLLKELRGESDPSFFDCIIAVSNFGAYLIASVPDLYECELFDDDDLEDNLTDTKNIPKEPGIYKCKIRVHTFRSNHPEDPGEWDMNVTISECEKINI